MESPGTVRFYSKTSNGIFRLGQREVISLIIIGDMRRRKRGLLWRQLHEASEWVRSCPGLS